MRCQRRSCSWRSFGKLVNQWNRARTLRKGCRPCLILQLSDRYPWSVIRTSFGRLLGEHHFKMILKKLNTKKIAVWNFSRKGAKIVNSLTLRLSERLFHSVSAIADLPVASKAVLLALTRTGCGSCSFFWGGFCVEGAWVNPYRQGKKVKTTRNTIRRIGWLICFTLQSQVYFDNEGFREH